MAISDAEKELNDRLARIRKTIAESENMVTQVGLRMAETDRMLERQGLTREQVMAMRFSEAQMEAVNAELKRRGLPPLEPFEEELPGRAEEAARQPSPDSELAERQRKFGMMMKPFQI